MPTRTKPNTLKKQTKNPNTKKKMTMSGYLIKNYWTYEEAGRCNTYEKKALSAKAEPDISNIIQMVK